MIPRSQLSGLILAGGRATRMQAQAAGQPVDKGLVTLHGQPLVRRAADFLQPWVAVLLISANRNIPSFQAYGQVVPDDVDFGSQAGPLAGVASALAICTTPWLVITPVDVARLPESFVPRLADTLLVTGRLMAYAKSDGHDHPLCAIIHQSLEPALRAWVLSGGRKVRQWLSVCQAVPVSFPACYPDFANINTPEDLWQAHQNSPREAPPGGRGHSN